MEYLIPMWEHQKRAIEAAKALENYGFFMEMGVGKTATCINTIREVWNEKKRLPRTLILCPPIVIENWKAEWLKNSKIPSESITCLVGSGKKREEKLRENGFDPGKGLLPHIFITNYQALLMPELYDRLLTWQPEVVVFDECHKLKDYKSKTSKLAERIVNGRMTLTKDRLKLTGPRPYVYCLSGSPILNNAMDIFQQYKILDAGETFGCNFFAFRSRYFRDKNAGMNRQNYFPNWQPNPGALDEIAGKMMRNSMRVLKKDCLDLPPLVKETIKVPMTPEQNRIYNEMLKDYVTFFEKEGKGHVASATLAITKGLRLMQLASGFVKTVDEKEVPVGEGYSPKQEALKELLEELLPGGHKVIVWAVWKQNYEQIREVLRELKVEWAEVHGEIPGTQKFNQVDRFNYGPARVLLGHPGSGGIGINLVSASYAIFYSRNFSLEQDLQAEARNYRGGSEIHAKVTRIDLVAEGSIEEKILERLACKQEVGESVLREITLELSKK